MALMANLRHFLKKDGSMAEMPSPARKLAEFLGRIVKGVTSRQKDALATGLSVEKDLSEDHAEERSSPL